MNITNEKKIDLAFICYFSLYLWFGEEMEVEHVGELVEEDKSGDEKDKDEEKTSTGNAILKEMLLLITADPGHESGEDSKEDHGANTAGKIECFEKEIWEGKGE